LNNRVAKNSCDLGPKITNKWKELSVKVLLNKNTSQCYKASCHKRQRIDDSQCSWRHV